MKGEDGKSKKIVSSCNGNWKIARKSGSFASQNMKIDKDTKFSQKKKISRGLKDEFLGSAKGTKPHVILLRVNIIIHIQFSIGLLQLPQTSTKGKEKETKEKQ